MADVAPDLIFHIAIGFMSAKHLFVANEIGIFEHLGAGSTTLEELARRVGVQPRPLRIVVDAMVALGLVERFEDRYRNAPVAEIYLTGLSRVDLRAFLRYWHHIHYPRVARLEEAVRSGRHVFAEGFTEEEQRDLLHERRTSPTPPSQQTHLQRLTILVGIAECWTSVEARGRSWRRYWRSTPIWSLLSMIFIASSKSRADD